MSPKSNDNILIRDIKKQVEGHANTEAMKREGHVKIEAKTGFMRPQAKEYLELQEDGINTE